MKTFSTFDAIKILNLERSTLKTWMEKGFITPSFKTNEGKGPGSKSRFKADQLYLIKVFCILLESGFSRKAAAGAIKGFRRIYNFQEPVTVIINFDKIKKEVCSLIGDYQNETNRIKRRVKAL